MKRTSFAILFSTLITLSSNARALELIVVKNYQEAESAELWKKSKADQVPLPLLEQVSIDDPTNPYSSLFPKSFLQEDIFAVCSKTCSREDLFSQRKGKLDIDQLQSWDVIEQSTVYYWLKNYFHFLENELQFRPNEFLKVETNKDVRIQGKKLKNNAFFDPQEVSLSFLPANKNLLFKLMSGKINRSGYDPSVIAHEASHYLFHHLFRDNINDEIDGVNEGFADYIANVFLKSPKVGSVMLQGRTLRDSSNPVDTQKRPKSYIPQLEVHDLGERVAFALWKTREVSSDKSLMDRMVIETIITLSNNPYASAHDFAEEFNKRLESILPSSRVADVKNFWHKIFPPVAKITNMNFLKVPERTSSLLGLKMRQEIPKAIAEENGIDQVTEESLELNNLSRVDDNYMAFAMRNSSSNKPYWIAIDSTRDVIVGIYQNNKLLKDKEELEKAQKVSIQARVIAKLYKEFQDRTKLFSELAQSKGPLTAGVKLTDKRFSDESFTFNNKAMTGKTLTLSLKRKLITGTLLGLPDIETLELHLLPMSIKGLAVIEDHSVIGYKMTLKDGTVSELALNHYDL